MNSIQAYIANENFYLLESNKSKLKYIRDYYNNNLKLNNISDHLYRINVDNNSSFIKYMFDNKIMCGIHYSSQHNNIVYTKEKFDCKNSEIMSTKTVSIPFNPTLSNKDMDQVVKKILEYNDK